MQCSCALNGTTLGSVACAQLLWLTVKAVQVVEELHPLPPWGWFHKNEQKNGSMKVSKPESLALHVSNVVPTIKSIGHWFHEQSESPVSCKFGIKMVPSRCAIYPKTLRVNDATSSLAKFDPHHKRLEGYQRAPNPRRLRCIKRILESDVASVQTVSH